MVCIDTIKEYLRNFLTNKTNDIEFNIESHKHIVNLRLIKAVVQECDRDKINRYRYLYLKDLVKRICHNNRLH